MSNVSGHAIMLTAVGVAALSVSYIAGVFRQAETAPPVPETVVVTVAPREPVGGAPAPQLVRTGIAPADRAALARELQRELIRVGCYQGEISGVWTTSSRMAMRSFIDRVNAALPIDNPDEILLALVQGYRARACTLPCPSGQAQGDDGRCLVSTIVTGANRKVEPGETKAVPTPPTGDPAGGVLAPAAATAAGFAALRRVAPPEPRGEPPRPVREERPRVTAAAPASQPPPAPVARDERPQRATRDSGPVPPGNVYEPRKRQVERPAPSPSQPPQFVRTVIKQFQKAAAVFGLR